MNLLMKLHDVIKTKWKCACNSHKSINGLNKGIIILLIIINENDEKEECPDVQIYCYKSHTIDISFAEIIVWKTITNTVTMSLKLLLSHVVFSDKKPKHNINPISVLTESFIRSPFLQLQLYINISTTLYIFYYISFDFNNE